MPRSGRVRARERQQPRQPAEPTGRRSPSTPRSGTLLFDLLTGTEEADDQRTGRNRFDIRLLAERLEHTVAFLVTTRRPRTCRSDCSGRAPAPPARWSSPPTNRLASPSSSREGGRPDLAGDTLAAVQAPTLLIVGGRDPVVLDLNREAAAKLRCLHKLVVVPGATHLFEEPGALDEVARLAGGWFATYLDDGVNNDDSDR